MKGIDEKTFNTVVKEFREEYSEYIDNANTHGAINKLINMLRKNMKTIKKTDL